MSDRLVTPGIKRHIKTFGFLAGFFSFGTLSGCSSFERASPVPYVAYDDESTNIRLLAHRI